MYYLCPNLRIVLVAMATEMLNLGKIYENHLLRSHKGIKLKLCRTINNISRYKNGVFIAAAEVLWLLSQLKFP